MNILFSPANVNSYSELLNDSPCPFRLTRFKAGLERCMFGAGEMAQWLRALVAFLEDPGSIPAHMADHNSQGLQF